METLIRNEKALFIQIEGTSSPSYGVHQKWLAAFNKTSIFMANRSCAVSCATNLYLYELQKLSPKAISQRQAVAIMQQIYLALRPRVWGIPFQSTFIRGLKKVPFYPGFQLQVVPLTDQTKEGQLAFIQQGIEADHLIAMITWLSPIQELTYHWVTITGYAMRKDGIYLLLSNWGKKQWISFDDWFAHQKIYGQLLYFEILPVD